MSKHELVTSFEKRWVLALAIIVMLITSIPYLIGYNVQGDAWRFTGFVIGVEDGNSYIAKMLSGAAGAWLFRSPYTAFPQQGTLMFFPYILLGKLASSPAIHEQLVAIFHLYRVIAGVLVMLATYDFLAFFLKEIHYRRFGLALVALGGGLGWLPLFVGRETWLGSLPLDYYSPETFGFLELFGFPHLALARALLLWTLLIYLRVIRIGSNPIAVVSIAIKMSVLWFVSGLFQPLVMVVIGSVIAVHLLITAIMNLWLRLSGQTSDWKRWLQLCKLVLISGVLPGLLVLYNLWVLWRDPFMAGWAEQNLIKSPHPWHYLMAYGLLVPFAWIGAKRLIRFTPWEGWLLVGWLLSLPILAYAPVNLQRRLPDGIWVAWVTVAMVCFDQRRQKVERRPARELFWPVMLLCLTIPSTSIIWFGGIFTSRRVDLPVFRPSDEVAIFEFLSDKADVQEVVLSAYETGNVLPAWAPLRVVVGHGPESVELAELQPQVASFYSSTTEDPERINFLNQLGVNYVFWGPAERQLGDWDPFAAPYLQLLNQSGVYSVFKYDHNHVNSGVFK